MLLQNAPCQHAQILIAMDARTVGTQEKQTDVTYPTNIPDCHFHKALSCLSLMSLVNINLNLFQNQTVILLKIYILEN